MNVLPDGATTQQGGYVGGYRNSEQEDATHAVSNDGSRVFWTEGQEAANGPLYMRDTVSEETVQVGPAGSRFQIASADGSKAFFTNEGNVLYVYDTLAGTLTELTAGAEVQGEVLGASEDGSAVYFVATGMLGGEGEPGQDNLYVAYETGSTWSTRLIAVFSGEDSNDWSKSGAEESGGMTSRVSPNGRFLAFMSDRSLTGYDNRDAGSGAPDEEVFLYDAADQPFGVRLVQPDGERPTGILDQFEVAKSDPPALRSRPIVGVCGQPVARGGPARTDDSGRV